VGVFSHGLGALGRLYFVILEAWAAEGYVVAAPDFPLSRANAPGGSTPGDYANQPADVRFVIDEMLRLNADPTSPLRERIDGARIGAAGQSLGGLTTFGVTLNTCCRDPRIAAAVPIAGLLWPFAGGAYDGRGAPPTLVIHGDADDTVPYAEARAAYATLNAPKALLTHRGGGHILPYVPACAPSARARACTSRPISRHRSAAPARRRRRLSVRNPGPTCDNSRTWRTRPQSRCDPSWWGGAISS
jgi:dienelactone hydrolase